ncbi:ATP synthase subunit I [uncultured Oceanisphaera sp.]|uniref:ATP synthase subunit I n=1 Tax=uncultured Oceanisphaera sp. TaxID=353858 RepID=UPI00262A5028|nr:ATP synthase subunit I [uncultured Oceanisphaera sp.]
MSNTLMWAGSGGAGLALGLFFFGGLWWTVRRGLSSSHPASLFLASLLLRTGIVLTGFYLVADGHWQRWLACLLGFVIGRLLLMRLLGPALVRPPVDASGTEEEKGHAP